MAIVGAMQDGLLNDFSTLAVKSVLDFIIIAVMTSSMGKGCAFSAIPLFVFEGCVTLLARLVSPIMTDTAVAYLSLVGSVLIFCIGINLVFGKKINVQICFRLFYLPFWRHTCHIIFSLRNLRKDTYYEIQWVLFLAVQGRYEKGFDRKIQHAIC